MICRINEDRIKIILEKIKITSILIGMVMFVS